MINIVIITVNTDQTFDLAMGIIRELCLGDASGITIGINRAMKIVENAAFFNNCMFNRRGMRFINAPAQLGIGLTKHQLRIV